MALRRADAVADEHQRRALEVDMLVAVHGRAHRDFLALGQGLALLAVVQAQLHRALDFKAAQRHVLGPAALALDQVAARFQAGRLELLDDEIDGLGFARGVGRAAFEFVRRQRLDVLRQVLRIELGSVIGPGRRGGDQQSNQQSIFHYQPPWV